MSKKQKTIAKEVSLSGIGLHTGKTVEMTFKPAPVNHGFAFKRIDLEGEPVVEASAAYVTSTERGTSMEKQGVKIHTSEHVLAACVGLDLDNILIEMNAAEPPIMDGSSKYFIEALESAEVFEQDADVEEFVVEEVISYKDDITGSEIVLMPSEEYQVTTMVDFGTKVLGTQNATLSSTKDFKEEISESRTFSFLHEIESMLEHDLIKGDLNNALYM